jgi:class 3 adenylate cyclase
MDRDFERLLLAYAEEQDRSERDRIQAQLWQQYGATRAVLVMDLSYFSALTEKFGIVYNLAIIRRMQRIARPIIEHCGGTVVKFEADNCFAMFGDVLSAIQAALSINKALQELNSQFQEQFEIHVGIGIDYGEVLLTGGPDFFGPTVNHASKLGEDMAGPGEILVTRAAFDQLPEKSNIPAEPVVRSISGLSFSTLSIKY